MKRKNTIIIIVTISFFCFSNGYILLKSPLIYTGGCSDDEYEAILFITKNLPTTSFIFTDLRLSSILRTLSNVNVVEAPGYQLSTFEELNVTYQVFYSDDDFKAYYCISNFLLQKHIPVKDFYILFSKVFTSEGITTMDFSFGPIPLEAYNKYLNSTYFIILFNNDESFVAKVNKMV